MDISRIPESLRLNLGANLFADLTVGPSPGSEPCERMIAGATGMAVGLPLDCEIVIGTRPEAIKLAPVIKALRAEPDFVVHVVTSGQHGEICRTALAAFGLTADSALDAEPIGGALADSAGELVRAFGRRLAKSRPGMLLVQGDTTTAMAAALAGFYAKVPVAHVEAGCAAAISPIRFRRRPTERLSMQCRRSLCHPPRQAQANLVAAALTPKGVRSPAIPLSMRSSGCARRMHQSLTGTV